MAQPLGDGFPEIDFETYGHVVGAAFDRIRSRYESAHPRVDPCDFRAMAAIALEEMGYANLKTKLVPFLVIISDVGKDWRDVSIEALAAVMDTIAKQVLLQTSRDRSSAYPALSVDEETIVRQATRVMFSNAMMCAAIEEQHGRDARTERARPDGPMLPINDRIVPTMLTHLHEMHDRGVDVTPPGFILNFVLQHCGVPNGKRRRRLFDTLMPLAGRWSVVIANDPTLASHDRSDEVERLLMENYFDPDGTSLSPAEEEMVREVAPLMYTIIAYSVHQLGKGHPSPVPMLMRRSGGRPPSAPMPPALTPADTRPAPREMNQAEEIARQRAGQRREARKLRAANEQAQASRSAVEVSDDAMRAVEERAAALELAEAAAAASAGQGGSGRRARTPSPVRTAEEEAEAEKKAEAARLRNEKAEAKRREQEEWLAKQRANKKGKGKGKAPAAAPTAPPQEPQERLPAPPRVNYEQAMRAAIEDRPRGARKRG